ncbi:unnamed protein product, partial [Prunus brigantina]
MEPLTPTLPEDPTWLLHVDGASNRHGGGAGIVLSAPDGTEVEYALRFQFNATNNEAEYEALIAGLRLAHDLGAQALRAHSDSLLIVNQINDTYQAKGRRMAQYVKEAQRLASQFSRFAISQVPRSQNCRADALAKLASALDGGIRRSIPIEYLASPTVGDTPTEAMIVEANDTWMTPIYEYLASGALPADSDAARRLRLQSGRYTIINAQLYKRGFSLPYLRCVTPEDGHEILREVHEGVCGDHSASRAMASKVLRRGYYWPTLKTDSLQLARKCRPCQLFSNIIRQPPEPLSSMTSPWPFAQWGLDLIGPMPEGKGQTKFAIVANILCRFGLPRILVTDNGRQFDNARFLEFCSNFSIALRFSSPAHPRANGQVEAVNKIIKRTLKKKLGDKKGDWAELLPEVLWAYRTTHRSSTGETPFSLTFRSEAMVPVEIGMPTHRVVHFDPQQNDEQLALDLDLVENRRAHAEMTLATYQQRAARHYDKNVRPRTFRPGDLVLRAVLLATRDRSVGTLGANWEGPYRVVAIV